MESIEERGLEIGVQKKGAYVLWPPKFFTFSDSEFNGDSDFAINHNLI